MLDRPHPNPSPEEEGLRSFTGYAAVWDRVDRAGDVFRRGAFGDARVVPLLAGHRGAPVGEARVKEDARGLLVEASVALPVRVGDGLSVGFRARAARQGVWRELLAAELVEVSLVRQPMQSAARVERVGEPQAAQLPEDSPAPAGGSASPSPSDVTGFTPVTA